MTVAENVRVESFCSNQQIHWWGKREIQYVAVWTWYSGWGPFSWAGWSQSIRMEVPFTGYKQGGDSPVGATEKRGEIKPMLMCKANFVTLTFQKIQILHKMPSCFIYSLNASWINHEILNLTPKHSNVEVISIDNIILWSWSLAFSFLLMSRWDGQKSPFH